MRQFLTVLLVAGLLWFGWKFYSFARREVEKGDEPVRVDYNAPAPGKLPGMPAHLEAELDEARRQGPQEILAFLARHRMEIRDPRLAEIQLDYVVLVGPGNRKEAKRMLEIVGARLTPDSPVYARYQALRKTYE